MKIKTSLLLHPLFILSIALLPLNDLYLKYEYHNSLTGKLSDFTGLFSFAIFWIAIFPKHKKQIVLTIALFFTWWKSSLSNPLINFCNYELNIPIARIVDPSDLSAILILPFSLLIKPVSYADTFIQKLAVVSICIVSFTAFTATSLPKRLTDDNKILLQKNLKTKKKENEIIKTLEDNGLGPITKKPIYNIAWHNNYYLMSKTNDSVMIPIDSLFNGLYYRIDNGSGYTIPKMYIENDSIYDLQFIVSEYLHGKTHITLYSFGYKKTGDSSYYGYDIWRKFKKPIKKKIKEVLEK